MKVWVVQSMTESGDDYSYVFGFKPTRAEILDVLYEDWSCEFGPEEDRYSDPDEWTINAPDPIEVEVITK